MQSNGRAETKTTGRFIDAVLGCAQSYSEDATPRELKEFDAGRDSKHQISS